MAKDGEQRWTLDQLLQVFACVPKSPNVSLASLSRRQHRFESGSGRHQYHSVRLDYASWCAGSVPAIETGQTAPLANGSLAQVKRTSIFVRVGAKSRTSQFTRAGIIAAQVGHTRSS
jgi:hypothetical protein